MRRVLFVAPYFPPLPGPGPQRCAKFAKYLPEFGWEPTVISVDSAIYASTETTLLDDIVSTRVIRLRTSIIPRRVFRVCRGILDRVLVPDSHVTWLPVVKPFIDRLLARESFHAALTSSAPFSLTMIGPVFRKHGVPWVTDYRDPWTLNDQFRTVAPIAALRPLHRQLESRAAAQCSFHISNTDGQLAQARRAHPVLGPKSTAIPNGFDSADFALGPLPEDSHDRPWRLVYTGSLYQTYRPDRVFACVRRFLDQRPGARVEIHYAGLHSRLFKQVAEEHGLDPLVRDHGHVDHRTAIAMMRSADLLLLHLPDTETARTWVPAKVYEYLAAGRPIFAVLPRGDASAILERASAGDALIGPSFVAEGAEVLARRYASFLAGRPALGAAFEQALAFGRRALTGRLAAVLDRVASGQPGYEAR